MPRPAIKQRPKPTYQDSEFTKAVEHTVRTIGGDFSSGAVSRVGERLRSVGAKISEGYRRIKKSMGK